MPTTSYVADASAILANLHGESGGEVVRDLLADKQNQVYCHAINACEVYYDVIRSHGVGTADEAIRMLVDDGIVIREDMDSAFWKDVGFLKVTPGKLSLADCVALALARKRHCELLTADHHEMDALLGKNIAVLRFVR